MALQDVVNLLKPRCHPILQRYQAIDVRDAPEVVVFRIGPDGCERVVFGQKEVGFRLVEVLFQFLALEHRRLAQRIDGLERIRNQDVGLAHDEDAIVLRFIVPRPQFREADHGSIHLGLVVVLRRVVRIDRADDIAREVGAAGGGDDHSVEQFWERRNEGAIFDRYSRNIGTPSSPHKTLCGLTPFQEVGVAESGLAVEVRN